MLQYNAFYFYQVKKIRWKKNIITIPTTLGWNKIKSNQIPPSLQLVQQTKVGNLPKRMIIAGQQEPVRTICFPHAHGSLRVVLCKPTNQFPSCCSADSRCAVCASLHAVDFDSRRDGLPKNLTQSLQRTYSICPDSGASYVIIWSYVRDGAS
jgi:hypothetical protein